MSTYKKWGGPTGYTEQDFLDAIKGSGGYVTEIARRLGCSRTTVYNSYERWPDLREAVLDEKEGLKDLAENELFRQIAGGNTTAVIFYLKTQAKDRGYIERQQYEHSGGIDVSKLSDEELDNIIAGKS
jgi:hypothetical protein